MKVNHHDAASCIKHALHQTTNADRMYAYLWVCAHESDKRDPIMNTVQPFKDKYGSNVHIVKALLVMQFVLMAGLGVSIYYRLSG